MDIIGSGGADYQMIAYLSIMIEEGMNMWVSGETASGKTTLLNAITTFISPGRQDRHASRTRRRCRFRTLTGCARWSVAPPAKAPASQCSTC